MSDSIEYNSCKEFVLNKLTGVDSGIYTNYLPAVSSNDLTRGHDVLAESQGLIMEYAVQTGNHSLFNSAWNYVKSNLLYDSGFVAWRVINGKPANSDASVDHLRIAGALEDAAQRFNDKSFNTYAGTLSAALLNFSVKDGILVNGYENSSTVPDSQVNLCYLDLNTMKKLSHFDSRWTDVYSKSLALINSGRIKKSMPLFEESWNINTKSFSQLSSTDTMDSMLTLYYLCQTRSQSSSDITWLTTQLNQGPIYTKYDKSGAAASKIESTAIYSLIMLSARCIGDSQLYDMAKIRLLRLQVSDKTSAIYGAFGDSATLQVYSFDNLLALTALDSGLGK
jgi:endo-1,4-beta-D-glucanase Y